MNVREPASGVPEDSSQVPRVEDVLGIEWDLTLMGGRWLMTT